jgi:hypothetical protein
VVRTKSRKTSTSGSIPSIKTEGDTAQGAKLYCVLSKQSYKYMYENTGSRIPSVEGAACVATATAQGAKTLLSVK